MTSFLSLFFLLFSPLVFGAIVSPWFSPLGEVEFRPSYSYRFFPSVNQGSHPSSYSSHDHLVDLNLALCFLSNWDFQLELDFAKTRQLSWGTERLGTQLRYLLLNDVAGDPVSVTLGLELFYVPTRNNRDVSSPYHGQGNMELGVGIGKEIDKDYEWVWRFFGFLGLGTANRGYPWLRPLLSAEFKLSSHHKFQGFSRGYFGCGGSRRVDIDHFDGYGRVLHQSVDVGVNYTYLFTIWGELGVQYAYRLYARSFPEYVSTLRFEYRFPFSLF